MKKDKKKKNYFFSILKLLFIVFIFLYIANTSGYYQSKISKKTTLTNESIKRFEENIRNNKPIDIDDYVVKDNENYSNKTTDAGIFLSKNIEKFASKGLNSFFDLLKSLFT